MNEKTSSNITKSYNDTACSHHECSEEDLIQDINVLYCKLLSQEFCYHKFPKLYSLEMLLYLYNS